MTNKAVDEGVAGGGPRDPELATGQPPPGGPDRKVLKLSDVETQAIEWLWQDRIPLGKLSLLDGDPGLGKSTLTLAIAASVTTGSPMPGQTVGRPPGNVLVIAVEDDVMDTIRPRMEAAGADLKRVFVVTGPCCLRDDLGFLKERIIEHEAVFVIIDPLMAVLGADANNDQKVRSVLTPLGDIAAQTGAAVLMVRHLTKGGGKSALHRGGGSMGIIGAARSALLFTRDPDDANLRVLAVTKSNLGPKADSIRLAFEQTEAGVAVIRFAGSAKQDADALLATSSEPEKRTQLAEAIDVLRDALAHGSVPVRDLQDTIREAGLSWATARRAQVQLGIVSEKAGHAWQWRQREGAQEGRMNTLSDPPSDESTNGADLDCDSPRTEDVQPEGAQVRMSALTERAVLPASNDNQPAATAADSSAEAIVRQQMLL